MSRALMLWGGNRKRLCFETWRQWAALKQGRRQALRQAMNHWQHLYLSQAFMGWRYYTQRAEVCLLLVGTLCSASHGILQQDMVCLLGCGLHCMQPGHNCDLKIST
jgi:hypothetical protein